jgi:hypothetical protein
MSHRLLLVVLAGLIAFGGGPAQAQRYGALPDSLPDRYEASSIDRLAYEGAPSAVVRLEARRLVVDGPEEATLYVRKAVTVFEEEGRHHGRLKLWYDAFVDIDDLEGRILDADGETIKELDDDYVSDRSSSGSSLYSDVRVRVAKLFADTYPYTVEYRYEKEITAPMRWPTWHPVFKDAPVELGQFEVEAPGTYTVRHSVRGDSLDSITEWREDRRVRRWRVTDRPAYDREPVGPSWDEQAPVVRVAPTAFETAGIRGNMSTWSAIGQWYHRLKEGRDELSPSTARNMRRIVDGATTKRDTVRRLYRHLQQETRYVSVQLGIGGWQPFPVSYVRERSYGDCKALTNYMEASLRAVGIRSSPVLINRGVGAPPVPREFPSIPFNHVVLAVPMARDTLWLENTDTTAPFGHVAADIEDRYGLMVTSEGGTLVRTPASEPADNRQTRTATVDLTSNGGGTASVRTTYTGNQQDRIRRRLVDKTPRERKKWLRRLVDVASFDLNRVDFSDVDAYQDTVQLPLKLGLPQYASKTGSRLFVPLNLMERWTEVPAEVEEPRTQSVRPFPYPFIDVDSVRYELPTGYEVEAVPDPVTIETPFATYEATVERLGDVLLYRRRVEWREKTLPPDQYEAFRSLLQDMVRADQAQAVLVETET